MGKYVIERKEIVKEEIDILPCPFCGSENVKPVHCNGEYGYRSSEDYVVCASCGAVGSSIKDSNCGNNLRLAIQKWNTRKQ